MENLISLEAIFEDFEIDLVRASSGQEALKVDFIPKPIISDILKGKVQVFLDLYHQRNKLKNLIVGLEETNINLKNAKKDAEEAYSE